MNNLGLVSTRIVFLIANFLINIFLANLILKDFGHIFFAQYAIITSIPSLIPFADLGLGASVFNSYVDSNNNNLLNQKISRIFKVSILGTLFQLFLFSTLGIFTLRFFIGKEPLNFNYNIFLILILSITYFAVPLSLATKKLQAENMSHKILLIQGLIPLFNLAGYLICTRLFSNLSYLIILLPSFSYFVTNIILFKESQIWRNIKFNFLLLESIEIRKDLKLGFWTILVSTAIAISWQIPKYYFGFFQDLAMVSNYTFFLMIILAAFSVIQIPAISISPKIRQFQNSSTKILKKELKKTFLISIILSIGLLIISELLKTVDFIFLDSEFLILAFVVISLSPLWILPFYTLSYRSQYRYVAKKLIFLELILVFSLSILGGNSFVKVVVYIASLMVIFFSISWKVHSHDALD